MNRFNIKLLFVFVSVFSVNAIYASNIALRVVDIKNILNKSPQKVVLNDRIKRQFSLREEEINLLQTKLYSEIDRLNSKGPVLKMEEHNKVYDKLLEKVQKFNAKKESLQKDLVAMRESLNETLTKQVNYTISDVSKEKHIVVVLKKEEIFYCADSLSLDDDVVGVLRGLE